MKLFFCDLETTGLEPGKHGIWQIAGILDIGGQVATEFNLRVCPFPGEKATPDVLVMHNLTMDKIKEYPEPNRVHLELTAGLGRYINKFDKTDKAWFVGYNAAKFDEPFLRAWWHKCGDKYFGSWFWVPVIDVMALAAYFLRDVRASLPNFQLGTVARYLNIPFDEEEAHDAMYDVAVTRDIYRALEKGLV